MTDTKSLNFRYIYQSTKTPSASRTLCLQFQFKTFAAIGYLAELLFDGIVAAEPPLWIPLLLQSP
jgi:hypothetical protein